MESIHDTMGMICIAALYGALFAHHDHEALPWLLAAVTVTSLAALICATIDRRLSHKHKL